ncbi:trypsin-like serine protease-like protein [Drosophila innubila nudivirus]|uniref:Trypsin-like serine protease-like protein n=1 Tax=Drosophila innubila nudivirus TaxID=2057187 RepID=A0A2H4UX99_9VIRU|nr:trypsin-like serine protease-like protein [Drosophila innubila nudivirus]ATZ81545.1 trypsin-like serine protease-like protein [Drosophila innubila nudivirus]
MRRNSLNIILLFVIVCSLATMTFGQDGGEGGDGGGEGGGGEGGGGEGGGGEGGGGEGGGGEGGGGEGGGGGGGGGGEGGDGNNTTTTTTTTTAKPPPDPTPKPGDENNENPWEKIALPDYQDHSITDYPASPSNNHFKWYVFIIAYNDPAKISEGKNCSGALVTYNSVVTAASCLYQNGTNERFKSATLLIGGVQLTKSIYNVSVPLVRSALIHPKYDPTSKSMLGNLAIISMYDALEPHKFVEPIDIAQSQPENRQQTYRLANHDYFGTTQQVVDNLGYRFMFLNQNFLCRWYYGPELCDGSILTAYSKFKKDGILCQVGSGAPLSVHTTADPYNNAEIIGISSFVSENGCNGSPGGFTSLIHYYDWLEANI